VTRVQPSEVRRARARDASSADAANHKLQGTQALAAAVPTNAAKPSEFGNAAQEPACGQNAEAADTAVTGSTLTEKSRSAKVGSGKLALGADSNRLSLDRVRTDASGQTLTTNQGVPVADNENSLKAGLSPNAVGSAATNS